MITEEKLAVGAIDPYSNVILFRIMLDDLYKSLSEDAKAIAWLVWTHPVWLLNEKAVSPKGAPSPNRVNGKTIPTKRLIRDFLRWSWGWKDKQIDKAFEELVQYVKNF